MAQMDSLAYTQKNPKDTLKKITKALMLMKGEESVFEVEGQERDDRVKRKTPKWNLCQFPQI